MGKSGKRRLWAPLRGWSGGSRIWNARCVWHILLGFPFSWVGWLLACRFTWKCRKGYAGCHAWTAPPFSHDWNTTDSKWTWFYEMGRYAVGSVASRLGFENWKGKDCSTNREGKGYWGMFRLKSYTTTVIACFSLDIGWYWSVHGYTPHRRCA